jgi:hypothetical protein
MSDAREYPDSDAGDGLVDRLRLIEDQPLEQRAAAYASTHDELRRVLESGDRAGL